MKCHQKAKNVAIHGGNLALQWWHCTDQSAALDFALTKLPLQISFESINACLTPEDQTRASGTADSAERLHFMSRRLLQDWFAAELAGAKPFRADSRLARTPAGAPYVPGLKDCSFSFSTTPTWAIAAACRKGIIGVDIEELRQVDNATSLARRFFAPEEAEAIALAPPEHQGELFLRIWSAKEACLKAIGRGMVYGPERVIVKSVNPDGYTISLPPELGAPENWRVLSPNFGSGLIITLAFRQS